MRIVFKALKLWVLIEMSKSYHLKLSAMVAGSLLIAGTGIGFCAPQVAKSWPPISPGYVEPINLGIGDAEDGVAFDDKTIVSPSDIGINGQTSYILGVIRGEARRWIFTFRRSYTGNGRATINKNACYLSATSNFLGDPQISPNGKILTFLVAEDNYMSLHSLYSLCFWDFTAHKVIISPILGSYPQVKWSPDSHYVGYFLGGDVYGGWEQPRYAPHLYIEDIYTGKGSRVSDQAGITSWAWTTAGSVLYTQFAQEQTSQSSMKGDVGRDSQVREYDLKTSKSTGLIPHASQPTPSPDNRWVAFTQLVSKLAEKTPETEIGGADTPRLERYSAIYNRKTHHTMRIGEALSYDAEDGIDYRWDAASNKLVSLQTTVVPNSNPTTHRCTVKSLDVSSLNVAPDSASLPWKTTARFYYRNNSERGGVEITPRAVTHDGTYLVCNIHDFSDLDGQNVKDVIEAVNIDTGQTHILANKMTDTNMSLGMDWYELPK